jgi:hypothetical protein
MKFNKKYFIVIGLVLIVFSGLVVYQNVFSGHAVLDINTEYHEGEALDGVLKLSLSEGEFIPASSVVIFEGVNGREEFVLEDIVSEEASDGVFYIEGKEISGEGSGYGFSSDEEVYPEISFEFRVFSGEEVETSLGGEDEIVRDVVDEELESVENSTAIKEAEGEPEEDFEEAVEDEIEDEEVASIVTGNVFLDLENTLSGSVSREDFFSYKLKKGESAELVSGSVTINSEVVNDNYVSLVIDKGNLLVSANYINENILNEGIKVIEIDLSVVDLNFSEGDLSISIVYGDDKIVSLSTVLKEDDVEEDASEEVVEEILDESEEPLNETNNTVIEILEVVSNNISEKDRQALILKFGSVSLKTTSAEVVEGRLVRNYKIGEYERISSYDYDGSVTDSLLAEIEKDRFNFLMDLVRMISEEEENPSVVEELLGNFEF